jgi:hypothetical protein
VFYCLSAFVLISCSSDSVTKKQEFSGILPPKELIKVNLDSLELKVVLASDIYNGIGYIPLETRPDILIGAIEDIQVLNDTLYILDSRSAKSIFVFTMNGKFIRRIGKVGRGPGEWTSPLSFAINETNRELYILDGNSQKIFVYSTNGVFRFKIDLYEHTARSSFISCMDKKIFLDVSFNGTEQSKYLLREIALNGIEINRWFPVPKYNKGWEKKYMAAFTGSQPIIKSSGEIKFSDIYMDTIFTITGDGVSPFIVLESKDLLTKEKLTEITQSISGWSDLYIISAKDRFVWGIQNYSENDDIIQFIYAKGVWRNVIIINKKDKSIKHLNYLIDDLTFQGNVRDIAIPQPICGFNKSMIGVVPDLGKLQEYLRTRKSSLSDEEIKMLVNLPITNNPVLFIINTRAQ